VRSLNCWVTLTKGATNELLFWQELPRVRFEGEIWPAPEEISIRMASGANNIGWGGIQSRMLHNMPQSSKYKELLRVYMCLQGMTHVCAGKFVLF